VYKFQRNAAAALQRFMRVYISAGLLILQQQAFLVRLINKQQRAK